MTGKGRSPRSHRTPGPAPHWPPVLCSIQHISGRDEGRLSMTQRRQAPPGTDTPTLPQSARHPNPSTICPTPQPLHKLPDTPTPPQPGRHPNLADTPTPPQPARHPNPSKTCLLERRFHWTRLMAASSGMQYISVNPPSLLCLQRRWSHVAAPRLPCLIFPLRADILRPVFSSFV